MATSTPLDEEYPRRWSFRTLAVTAFTTFVVFGLGTNRLAQTSFPPVANNCNLVGDDSGEGCEVNLGLASSRGRALQHVSQRSSNGHVPSSVGPQFVFFAGLEGTGHHTMQGIYKSSPAKRVIEALNLTEPLEKLETLLFHTVGFMFEHCDAHLKDESDSLCRTSHLEKREGCMLRNARSLFARIRATLKENDYKHVFVPLNIMGIMASYPDGVGPCRAFKYPSLDRLYAVCDYAGVPCRHVYLVRDPLSIVRSTVHKRHFYANELEALQLQTTVLNVLFAQMHSHAEKLLGCVEVIPTKPSSNASRLYNLRSAATVSTTTHATTLERSVGEPMSRDHVTPSGVGRSGIDFSSLQLVPWLGWQRTSASPSAENAEFESLLQRSIIEKPSLPLHEEDVVPPELRFHLSSLLRSHEAVIQLCATGTNRR
jgi:hypothetical protein